MVAISGDFSGQGVRSPLTCLSASPQSRVGHQSQDGQGAQPYVPPTLLAQVTLGGSKPVSVLIRGIKQGRPADDFVAAIELCATVLAEHFPPGAINRDDGLIWAASIAPMPDRGTSTIRAGRAPFNLGPSCIRPIDRGTACVSPLLPRFR
jgi:hypothetical protein